jgi:hypothetical protein
MNKLSWIVCATSAFALGACGDSGRPGTGTDGGGIMLMDGGPSGTDGGPSGTDGGGGTCPPVTLPPPDPACSQATFDCIIAALMAMDMTALNTCVTSNADGDACISCLDFDLISCGTMNGCAQAAGDLECCAQDRCAGLTGGALGSCLDSMCAAQGTAFEDCVVGTIRGGTCGITMTCLMSGGGFLPDFNRYEHVDWERVSSTLAAFRSEAYTLPSR